MTAQDLIVDALMLIGAYAGGETPTFDDMMTAFNTLNDLIEDWSSRSLLSSGPVTESFPLTANVNAYSIGSGQTFNTGKPLEITDAWIRQSTAQDYSLNILTRDIWDSLSNKGTTPLLTGKPLYLFYDPAATQQATQAGTINIYPAPDTTGFYTLFLESIKLFTQFVALTDTVTFPANYNRGLKYNLAVDVAPKFGTSVSPEVYEAAKDSLKAIKSLNAANNLVTATFEMRRPARFNINSGE